MTLGAVALVILSSIVGMMSIFKQQEQEEEEEEDETTTAATAATTTARQQQEIPSQGEAGSIPRASRSMNYVRADARIALTTLDHPDQQTPADVVANATTSNSASNSVANSNASDNNGKQKEDNDDDNNSNRRPISASCGQVLTEDAILSHDLECTGIGMIAGKDGITIRLNNHKLSSLINTNNNNSNHNNHTNSTMILELESIGISIPNANNVTIVGPGVITGFNTAIEFAGSEVGRVLDLKLADNKIGIMLKASNNIAIQSTSIEGNAVGIASQSSRAGKINFNQIFQNTDQGIVLIDSDYFTISSNSVIDSGDNGIFLDIQSFNNTISYNNLFNQTSVDINNANGVPNDILSNEFVGNICRKTEPAGLCH
jgi:parallel beta-helix repeat protein